MGQMKVSAITVQTT